MKTIQRKIMHPYYVNQPKSKGKGRKPKMKRIVKYTKRWTLLYVYP